MKRAPAKPAAYVFLGVILWASVNKEQSNAETPPRRKNTEDAAPDVNATRAYNLCVAIYSLFTYQDRRRLRFPREKNVSVSDKVAAMFYSDYRAPRREPHPTPPGSPTRTLDAPTSVTPPSASTRRICPPVRIDR